MVTKEQALEELRGIYIALEYLEEMTEATELESKGLGSVLRQGTDKLRRELGKEKPKVEFGKLKGYSGDDFVVSNTVFKDVEGQIRRLRKLESNIASMAEQGDTSHLKDIKDIASGFELILVGMLDEVSVEVDKSKSILEKLFTASDASAEELNANLNEEDLEELDVEDEHTLSGEEKEASDSAEKLIDSLEGVSKSKVEKKDIKNTKTNNKKK